MLGKIIAFVAGAAIGSLVTLKLVKDKYDSDYQRDVEETREALRKHYTHTEEVNEQLKEENKNLRTNAAIISKCGYGYPEIDVIVDKEEKDEEEENDSMKPYIITPEEYSESDCPQETLNYYQDGVVTDQYDDPISDDTVELWVGRESLNHFGEYEEDSVFVHNPHLNCDYEILADERTWDQVLEERKKYANTKRYD